MTTNTALITAESHLATYDYAGNRPTLLLYFMQMLTENAANSQKANAVQKWLNDIIFIAALDPENIKTALTEPPYSFSEVVQEAVSLLQLTANPKT